MNKVPVMISTKDLAYLSDMFDWNFNASKELNHFSNEAVDMEVKQKLHTLALMHSNICYNLISILKGE